MENLETKAKEMFSKLEEHIGEEVFMRYWTYGSYCVEFGVLSFFSDFGRIQVGCVNTPFVGYGTAVISVETEDGESLYAQPLYEPFNERDAFKIIEVRRRIFGDRIADEELEKQKAIQRNIEESERKEQEVIAEFKATGAKEILEKTLPYVIDESKEGFIEMVNNNSDDTYGIAVVKMTSDLIIAIGNGMDFEEVINMADEKYGASGYAMGRAANIISHCSARGKEFRKYWNGSYEAPEDTDGTVNPAILVLSRKE